MKVKNMTSNNRNPVPNQFIITLNQYKLGTNKTLYAVDVFQSYDSVIVLRGCDQKTDKLETYLDEKYWDYSLTTGRYRNQFLGEGIADTRKKIESGEYKLVNLN